MDFIKNMKIMTKLVLGFVIISILSAAVGVFSIQRMLDMDKRDTAMYVENIIGLASCGNMTQEFLAARIAARGVIMKSDKTSKMEEVKTGRIHLEAFEKEEAIYEKTITVEEDRKIFNEMKDLIDKYSVIYEELEKAVQEDKTNQDIITILGKTGEVGEAAEATLKKIQKFNEVQAKERSDSNTSLANSTINIMIIVVIVSAVVSLLLGISIAVSISRPINILVDAGKKLSLGDVNIKLDYDAKNEVGVLVDAFKKLIDTTKEQTVIIQKIAEGDMTADVKIRSEADIMNKKLSYMLDINNRVFADINKASEQVNMAAEQVAQGATSMAQSATEQSSTIEEITATVVEISGQARENAANAREANIASNSAKDNATLGAEQMRTMVVAMDEINEASARIAKIIKVIDDIAFQTNILALNAAVEAARAGSHGKGFAVVAEEVRNLAARSAQAAKETTDLIEGTIKKINNGNNIAKETAEGLKRIVDIVQNVSDMIDGIATSSGEQATAVAQVSQAVTQISSVVQTNSATAEESAAASEELAGQAMVLRKSISRFKIRGGESNHSFDNEIMYEKGLKDVEDWNTIDSGNGFGKY